MDTRVSDLVVLVVRGSDIGDLNRNVSCLVGILIRINDGK